MKTSNKLILLLLCPVFMSAQRPPQAAIAENINFPRVPMDTIKVDEKASIITFTNNTWEYYYPNLTELTNADIYRNNWVENQIFAYRSESFTIPDVVELKLVDDLSGYHAPGIRKVFSSFKQRGRRFHNGVDLPFPQGQPIYAAFDGKVRHAKYNTGGYGNLVIIRHENGLETYYAHLTAINTGLNEYVRAGEVIGYCGSTGRSGGAHLHFEVRFRDIPFDPERLIDFETGELRYTTFLLEKDMLNKTPLGSDTLDETVDIDGALENADSLTSEQILSNIEQAQTADEREKQAQAAAAAEKQYHTIRSGDTLGAIARRYGTTVAKLCSLNGIKETTILSLGRKLRVK